MSELPKTLQLQELSKHVGTFSLPLDLIKKSPSRVLELFGKVIVTRAEFVYGRNIFIYEAMSMEFIPLIVTNAPPTIYSIQENNDGSLRFIQAEFLEKLNKGSQIKM